MNQKRDRLRVIHDILRAISENNEKIKPTHILYKANLSNQMLDEYLNYLIQQGFVREIHQKKGKSYALTDKGFNYLKEYRLITNFMDSFGLN